MEPFVTLTGIAAPLLLDDIDTDQLAPVSDRSRRLDPDYAQLFFARKRRLADGSEDAAFVLNRPQFRSARILVTGASFGCGSARESAVWSLTAFGIRCIIARSFAETYRENCLRNGVLPVVLSAEDSDAFAADVVRTDGSAAYTVDLRSCSIVTPAGRTLAFVIAPGDRAALLEGTDLTGLTLRHADAIAEWEARARATRVWLQAIGNR